ncbi:hypothetical protein Mapa_012191 [Marchantia paleacea]|nr:hypothetical protein Mapa_012191 [Marchantia paleacea]
MYGSLLNVKLIHVSPDKCILLRDKGLGMVLPHTELKFGEGQVFYIPVWPAVPNCDWRMAHWNLNRGNVEESMVDFEIQEVHSSRQSLAWRVNWSGAYD